MRAEITTKEQTLSDLEKSINDFFVEIVEKTNERIAKETETIRWREGVKCSEEPAKMLVSEDRDIWDNIESAMSSASENMITSIHAQTETVKYQMKLLEKKEEISFLESEIKSRSDLGDELANVDADLQQVKSLATSISDLSNLYAESEVLGDTIMVSDAFYRLENLAKITTEKTDSVMRLIEKIIR